MVVSSCDAVANSPSWSIERKFPSEYGQGRELIDVILNQMTEQGWSGRDIFAVNMALEESFSNAIEHGNNCNPDKYFYVVCRISKDLVYISVKDEGVGFQRNLVPNPTEEENLDTPSGRGVLLINGFMSKVWYNDTGNEIFMEKTPSPKENVNTKNSDENTNSSDDAQDGNSDTDSN